MNNMLDRKNRKNLLIDENEIKLENVVKNYGRMVNLSLKLINDIDFNDKKYINRIYNEENELDIQELKESIENIGLINIVYLLKKENNKFIIVSGLRRLTACREIYNEGKDIKARERVVIFEIDTPIEYLEHISLDENTKRKDLKLIELSYKLNKESEKEGVNIEEIMQKYNISRRHYFRIKGAVNLPEEIKNIIEEIGLAKAELLTKIFHLSENQLLKDIIEKYQSYTKEELQTVINQMKKGKKQLKAEFESKGNRINIKIRKKIPEDVKKYLIEITEKIEKGDYSFL